MHLRNKSCECFVCFFRSRGRHDVWDSYCADKQLQIYLASQLVGGWVVKTRRGGQIEAIQARGGKKPSGAILSLLMLSMVKRNHLHPAMRIVLFKVVQRKNKTGSTLKFKKKLLKVSFEAVCKRKRHCGHEVVQNDLKYERKKSH